MNTAASPFEALKRFFSGIQVRFLCFFGIALTLSLAASGVLVNGMANGVMQRMSERTTLAELNQICDNLSGEFADMRRQTTLLELDSNVSALVERQLFSLVERTSIQMSLRDTVKSMFASFPALKAVYLYSRDGTLLMFGPSTVRSFDAWPQWELPGRVAKETASAVRFYGAVEQQGMPQPFYSHDDAPPLLLAGVRVKGGALLLGFSARVLEEHYAALAQTAQGGVYLLDGAGRVLSCGDESALGTVYVEAKESGVRSYRRALGTDDMEVVYRVYSGGYTQEMRRLSRMTLLSLTAALVITAGVFLLWLRRMLRPVTGISRSMERVEQGDYSLRVDAPGMDELSKLARQHNGMLESLQRLTDMNAQAERERREYELQALRNQINPHFLYNTLNTLKWMAMMEGSRRIADCLADLGGLLAPLIRAKNPLCPLSEEIELSRRYLKLMNTRYMTEMPMEVELPEELMDAAVPRLCLQPLIENAILHGFAPEKRWGTILVRGGTGEGDRFWLEVADDGADMPEEKIEELNRRLDAGERCERIGVVNTGMRVRLHFGADCGARVSANPGGGVRVRLELRRMAAQLEN